ncbi:MAG: AAA family ATPase [Bryobacterales bacterium]|nr:AAA family ATPase [Bryobacterales bacterium]
MEQIRTAVFSRDKFVREQVEDVLRRIHAVSVVHHTTPVDAEQSAIASFFQLQAPWIVFIDIGDLEASVELAKRIGCLARGTQMVAVGTDKTPETVVTAMRAGMREFLTVPVSTDETLEALARLMGVLRENPPENPARQHLISFLPAKPGAGASTLCVNVAAALAGFPRMRIGLLDFDLHCSVLEFLLKMQEGYTLFDAASRAAQLDDDMWRRMVRKAHGVDILLSNKQAEATRVDGSELQVAKLIAHARGYYEAICMDLPGQLDACSLEVMRNSNRIVLVSTTELTSLHSARQAVRMLEQLGFGSRISLVLNRVETKSTLSMSQMEDLIGRETFVALPNDYTGVQMAVREGAPVDPNSRLGVKYREIAQRIVGQKQTLAKKPAGKRLFGFLGGKPAPQAKTAAW